ncbi:hypothetical protein BKA62DRAFT_766064 [Auriculariales sp. MPI-PUGE-AT-0066]|nr:hypothetical protein BKA62DRAFT_766064 [Auriculariales sp. MPI-PUGE-AT-0066]
MGIQVRGNASQAVKSIIEQAKEAWEKWLAAHSGSGGGNNATGGHSSSGNSGSNSGSGGSQNSGSGGGSNSGTGGNGGSGNSSSSGSNGSGGGGGGDDGQENHTSSDDHGAAHNSTSAGESPTKSHEQSGATSSPGPTSGNSTVIEPTNNTSIPSSSPTNVPTSTLSEPNGTTLPQNSARHKVNIAAIVAPVVLLTLLLLGVLALILWRRRRAAHRQIRLESSSDVGHIPTLPPSRPSPFATFSALATRLRGGAPTPVVPVMVQPPSTASRHVSLASTTPGPQFEVRHPFAAPLYPSISAYSFGAGSSSWVAAHGHSDSQSGQMPFPHSSSSPSLPEHTGLYGHRYGASASGSIVGSGMFSLASAHHGHGPGLTPANELTDPFNGPAPARPYSVAGTEDSIRSDSQLGRRSEFVPDPDAPPVPPKPLMSPLSPFTPGSAFPLLGTGLPVRTPGEESQFSYLGDTESGPEPEPEAVVHLARKVSIGPAAIVNAPKPPRTPE